MSHEEVEQGRRVLKIHFGDNFLETTKRALAEEQMEQRATTTRPNLLTLAGNFPKLPAAATAALSPPFFCQPGSRSHRRIRFHWPLRTPAEMRSHLVFGEFGATLANAGPRIAARTRLL
jgi:hypothetical protein